MFDRLISSLVALSLASLVWLYMRSRDQEMLDNVQVPVSVSVSPGQRTQYELEVDGPTQVPVSFSGPPSRIREVRSLLQRGELRVAVTVSVPADSLEEARFRDTVRIEAGDIHPPSGVTPIVHEGRNRIPITLHRLVERRLEVRFEATGPQAIAQSLIEPASVLVRGPQEILDKARWIPTMPQVVKPRNEPLINQEIATLAMVPLVCELEGRRIRTSPETVAVKLALQPQQRLYELADVPIHFLCPAGFTLKPLFGDERAGRITLRVQGPFGDEVPAVTAFIDLSGRKWEPGLYEERLKLQLPKDFQLAQAPPRLVTFQLVLADAVPAKPGNSQRGP